LSGGCLERSGDRKPTVRATVDTTVTLSQMPNVDMRGVYALRSSCRQPLGNKAATSVLTLRGDRSRHHECCGLGSITFSQPFLHVVQANTVSVGPRGTGEQLLQREGIQFDFHEWETPTKGKYNIDKIQRAAQNMAEVYVAARYLHNKAVTVLNAAQVAHHKAVEGGCCAPQQLGLPAWQNIQCKSSSIKAGEHGRIVVVK